MKLHNFISRTILKRDSAFFAAPQGAFCRPFGYDRRETNRSRGGTLSLYCGDRFWELEKLWQYLIFQ